MPYWVLDQSVMRSLPSKRKRPAGYNFVIPDVAFIEMVKNDNWEDTIRRSFCNLSDVLNRTHVALSISEILQNELAPVEDGEKHFWRSTGQSILKRDSSRHMRQLVQAVLDRRQRSSTLANVRAKRGPFLARELNPYRDKAAMQGIVGALRAAYGDAIVSDLRSGRMSRDAQLGLVIKDSPHIFRKVAETSPALCDPNTCAWRHGLVLFRQALTWLAKNGLDLATPERLSHDRFDVDYVLTASYFDDLEPPRDCRRLVGLS